MKYMLMLYADTRAGAQIPPAEMAKWMEKMGAYAEALSKAGAYVSHGGLAPFWEATTVNLENGEMKVHDGPYVEAREQIGGYYIINAPDMSAAQHWRRSAQAPFGATSKSALSPRASDTPTFFPARVEMAWAVPSL